MAEYEAGVCNIGKAEQRKRYFLGLAGIFSGLLLSYLIAVNFLPSLVIAAVLLALILGFEGLFQGFLNFCAGFASKGIYDTSEEGGNKEEVEDDTERKKDKIRAMQIHMYSITAGITATAFIFLALTVF